MGMNDFLKVLPEMVTFVRVVEMRSFSAAARQLGMTPSAVSRHVTRLEKELGVQLIRRTTRQLRLTEPGIGAFERCCELVAAAQATMTIAGQYASRPMGRVRISAPKAFARHVLHPLILEFLRLNPEMSVQLVVADRDVDPIREGLDLVIRLTQKPPKGLAGRELMAVEHILCATPRYLETAGPVSHPKDLAAHSCLFLGEHVCDNRWRFCRGDDVCDVTVDGRYVANHSEIRLGGVLAHLGIGCVPDFVARAALESGEVSRVLPEWELLANYQGGAYILYPPSRFTVPKCRVVIDYLVEKLSAR
jgi:DNA-binding transcriptional LysR family regulator